MKKKCNLCGGTMVYKTRINKKGKVRRFLACASCKREIELF